MVKGVTEGFVKKLEIQGVGFKAAVTGKVVNLTLGYSHPINYDIPDQIKVTVEENTKLTIEGPDKKVVGQVASEIRGFYPPEPYKGKGVRYVGRTRPAQGRQDGPIINFVHGPIRGRVEMRTEKKQKLKQLRRWRIRKKVTGTSVRPRMAVCFTKRKYPRPVH